MGYWVHEFMEQDTYMIGVCAFWDFKLRNADWIGLDMDLVGGLEYYTVVLPGFAILSLTFARDMYILSELTG
jgi:hypothetical protein